MDELHEQFSKLTHRFVLLAREVDARGGYIIFEWLAHSRLWNETPTRGDGGPIREGFVPLHRALPLWQWLSHVCVVCLARRFLFRRACGLNSCDELFLVRAYAS